MKFPLIIFKTALYLATEKGNIEIICLLLNSVKIDINEFTIFTFIYEIIITAF